VIVWAPIVPAVILLAVRSLMWAESISVVAVEAVNAVQEERLPLVSTLLTLPKYNFSVVCWVAAPVLTFTVIWLVVFCETSSEITFDAENPGYQGLCVGQERILRTRLADAFGQINFIQIPTKI